MHQPPRQISQAKDAPLVAVHGGRMASLQTTQWQHVTELTVAHMGHFDPRHSLKLPVLPVLHPITLHHHQLLHEGDLV